MAFGSGHNSQQASNSNPKPPQQQHHHHHHHHRHHQQQQQQQLTLPPSGLGGGGGTSSSSHHHHHQHPHPHQQQQQQQSVPSSATQKCSVPSSLSSGAGGVGGGGGAPPLLPPNLPPKNTTTSASGSSSNSYYQSDSHPHHHHQQQRQQQLMFLQQGGGGSGGSSSNNNNNSASSFNSKSKQSFHIHPHHLSGQGSGLGGGGGCGEGISGGGQQQQPVNSLSSSSMSQQQQQYNQQQQVLFGVSGSGDVGSQQPLNRDLSDHERLLLEQIRAKKASLLKEIAQLQDEIDSVSKELLFSHKDSIDPHHHTTVLQPPPPPDLIQGNNPILQLQQPPLADIELDNLSEHSNNNDDVTITDPHHPHHQQHSQRQQTTSSNKIPLNSVLGSNNSSNSGSSASNSKERDRLKIMSLGCKKFNMDQKKGIEFLVENGLLKKDDDMDIGMFLYRGEGLNKTAIGDYLGEKNDFNESVLKVFVGLHDFTDLILVQALRQFLWSFRLPGEAQKIDRMMECFAQRYCQNNPDIFTNTDTCYVLSFAIIMLNTSLHNPSVKDKPTVEQFISMNRGINNGGDLPRELLISLYNSIQSEPFKIPEDDGNDLMTTFFNPDKEGWLWKQGGRYKTWKRRWFILNDNCLYYFEFTTDKEPRGIIPLENVGVRENEDGGREKSRQRYCFELYATDGSEVIKACKTDSDGRVVEGKHSVYRMSAASGEERDSWVKALRQSISYSPFYEILRKSGGGGAGGNSSSSLRAGGGGGSSRIRGE